jgi:hypothetical protein
MALGPREGRIVAFVLGPFFSSFDAILAGTDDPVTVVVDD